MISKKGLEDLMRENQPKTLKDVESITGEITKSMLELLLAEEMNDHLGYKKHDYTAKETSNSRNGYSPKTIRTDSGDLNLDIPRDRKSEFEPVVVKKGESDFSMFKEKIISMYARGMSYGDIKEHLKDIYDAVY